jgi:hypothetical protein
MTAPCIPPQDGSAPGSRHGDGLGAQPGGYDRSRIPATAFSQGDVAGLEGAQDAGSLGVAHGASVAAGSSVESSSRHCPVSGVAVARALSPKSGVEECVQIRK